MGGGNDFAKYVLVVLLDKILHCSHMNIGWHLLIFPLTHHHHHPRPHHPHQMIRQDLGDARAQGSFFLNSLFPSYSQEMVGGGHNLLLSCLESCSSQCTAERSSFCLQSFVQLKRSPHRGWRSSCCWRDESMASVGRGTAMLWGRRAGWANFHSCSSTCALTGFPWGLLDVWNR